MSFIIQDSTERIFPYSGRGQIIFTTRPENIDFITGNKFQSVVMTHINHSHGYLLPINFLAILSEFKIYIFAVIYITGDYN